MSTIRQVAGGGRAVEVEPARLVAWMERFAARNGGIASLTWTPDAAVATAGNGTTAVAAAPFGPMAAAGEPLESLLAHIDAMGDLAAVLIRGGAHSVGIVRAGAVIVSSTDARYLQGRTAAGGWSQQRYQRRRGNQRRDAVRAAAATARRVLQPHAASFCGVVTGGERHAIAEILDDPALAFLTGLPQRTFTDIAEPRRVVLDAVARRALSVDITIRDGGATSRNGTPTRSP